MAAGQTQMQPAGRVLDSLSADDVALKEEGHRVLKRKAQPNAAPITSFEMTLPDLCPKTDAFDLEANDIEQRKLRRHELFTIPAWALPTTLTFKHNLLA